MNFEVIASALHPYCEDEKQKTARGIVLLGLQEHFGDALDPTLNPDLDHMNDHFLLFLVGHNPDDDKQIICTGALSLDCQTEDRTCFRIERVSVLKEFRRRGYASAIVKHLIHLAQSLKEEESFCKNIDRILVETDTPWKEAIVRKTWL